MQQQTTYAQARSKDPRNQIYGQGNTYVDPRAVNPFAQRPAQSSGGAGYPAAMLTPPSQTWRNNDLSKAQAPAPAGLDQLVQQAQQDNQAMTQQPDVLARAQSLLANRGQGQASLQSGGLAGIDVGQPQDTGAAISSLGTEQGLENAGLTPRLPTTPPEPITKEDKTFTQPAVDASKTAVSNLFQAQAPNQGIAGATAKKDQERINTDLQKVAESKNPHAAWQDLKKEPFYQNSSFYTGLMGVGLSIMSGRDPLEAFQVGSQMADQDDMKKQLSANRDALLDQGYSADSVAQAVAQGDPRFLKMRQLSPEAQAAQEDQRWQQRYDTQRQDALVDQETSAKQQLASDKANDARYQKRMQDQEQRSKNLIDYRANAKAQQAEQEAQSFNFNPKELRNLQNTGTGKSANAWIEKGATFRQSNKDLDIVEKAVDAGDNAKSSAERDKHYSDARSAYIQAILNTVRAEIGTNRSISPEDLGHFAEDPSVFVKTGNQWSLKAGWKPTESAIRYARSQANVGSESVDKGVNQSKAEIMDTLIGSGMDKKRAVALTNRAIPWGKFYDPYGVFESSSEEAVGGGATRGGALSMGDTSWMQSQ